MDDAKGVVEGVVKYSRQNFFVPVPQVRDLEEHSYRRGADPAYGCHNPGIVRLAAPSEIVQAPEKGVLIYSGEHIWVREIERTGNKLTGRLSNDPRSPHYNEELLARGIGIRFRGAEKTNVEEYCVSEGWIRVAAGKARDRPDDGVANDGAGTPDRFTGTAHRLEDWGHLLAE